MKTAGQAYHKMITEKNTQSYTRKAKKGDWVQSFDVTMPADLSRGSWIGKVTEINTDPTDGVDYVWYNQMFRIFGGEVEGVIESSSIMRAPQNGQKSTSGKKTDGINIIGKSPFGG